MTKKVDWSDHIELSEVIGILNRLKHVYSQNVLLSIYHSLFASYLNYGLILWGTHLNRVLKCFISIDTDTHYQEILEKVKYKTHTWHDFSYNVKEKYLGTYKYGCSNLILCLVVACNTSFTNHGLINWKQVIIIFDLTKQKHYLCVNVVWSIFSWYMTDYAIMCVRTYVWVYPCT